MEVNEVKIKDLPLLERPREKALRLGIDALSDEEVIAIILGSGVKNHSVLSIAKSLLQTHNGLVNLSKIKTVSLMKTKGLSTNKALALIAAFSLGKRVENAYLNKQEQIRNSVDIVNYFKKSLSQETKESLYVIILDRKRTILRQERLYLGTDEGFEIDVVEVVRTVLVNNGYFFILLHNHPSGKITPSTSDVRATLEISKLADKFSLRLLDHIIIGANNYFSFSENNLLIM
ncbi:MAG: RadC family protein [Bacilli bacterium]